MRFEPTPIEGVVAVELEPHDDARGFFARAFCAREFAEHGLVADVVQANLGYNVGAGTTRGLHYQDERAPEAKFFRCIAGATFNVAVDLRPGSPTFGAWTGVHLSAENRTALYVPPLCAAGYQALTDGAEILYLASGYYDAEAERGVRYDDPSIGIEWPLEPRGISDKDAAWPMIRRPQSTRLTRGGFVKAAVAALPLALGVVGARVPPARSATASRASRTGIADADSLGAGAGASEHLRPQAPVRAARLEEHALDGRSAARLSTEPHRSESPTSRIGSRRSTARGCTTETSRSSRRSRTRSAATRITSSGRARYALPGRGPIVRRLPATESRTWSQSRSVR